MQAEVSLTFSRKDLDPLLLQAASKHFPDYSFDSVSIGEIAKNEFGAMTIGHGKKKDYPNEIRARFTQDETMALIRPKILQIFSVDGEVRLSGYQTMNGGEIEALLLRFFVKSS